MLIYMNIFSMKVEYVHLLNQAYTCPQESQPIITILINTKCMNTLCVLWVVLGPEPKACYCMYTHMHTYTQT